MELAYTSTVNSGFGWLLTLLAIIGYILTLKKTGERWLFWIVMATGWALFAVDQTLLITGQFNNLTFLMTLGLSSWILVITSLMLAFLKITTIMKASRLSSGNLPLK